MLICVYSNGKYGESGTRKQTAHIISLSIKPRSFSHILLGFPLENMMFIGAKSVETPDSFNIHPHLKKTHVETRIKKLTSGTGIDWATAEALAIGSLLYQGEPATCSRSNNSKEFLNRGRTRLVGIERARGISGICQCNPKSCSWR